MECTICDIFSFEVAHFLFHFRVCVVTTTYPLLYCTVWEPKPNLENCNVQIQCVAVFFIDKVVLVYSTIFVQSYGLYDSTVQEVYSIKKRIA